jgi:hypothetical protein
MGSSAGSVTEERVPILDWDPDLARGLTPARRAEARERAVVTRVRLRRGSWPGISAIDGASSCYGLVVLDGLISREVVIDGAIAAELLGAGDLIRPGSNGDAQLMDVTVRWTVLERSSVAPLDERFIEAVRDWPEIVAALFERVALEATRLATHRAICQLARVEDRVLAVMWYLAERWGRIAPHGVVLPLRLTHETIGRLVGARRPTVSLGIRELRLRRELERRSDGSWFLPGRPRAKAAPIETMPSATFVESVPESWARLSDRTNGSALPGPAPVDSAPAERLDPNSITRQGDQFAELRARLELLRSLHDNAQPHVADLLARSRHTRSHSAELRARVRFGRRRSPADRSAIEQAPPRSS